MPLTRTLGVVALSALAAVTVASLTLVTSAAAVGFTLHAGGTAFLV